MSLAEEMEYNRIVVVQVLPESGRVKWFYNGGLQVDYQVGWDLREFNMVGYAGVRGKQGII